ncbi:MAG: AMP-binding protein [Halieaceae bacterium]|jgi:acyl-CoA synthetase (AMP-forming)/AMP-acid ligase II|nr:AMP-binding protein [Halieaceae bacterium]
MRRHQFPKFSEEYSAHWRAEGLWSDITLHDGFDTTVARSPDSVAIRSAPELISKLEKVWGVKTGNTYGMGETIIHTMTLPDDPDEKIQDTVGQPIPGAQLKIVSQADRSVEQMPNEIGEICFRGPTLFVGYHKQTDLTEQTRDESGWFYTGDLGFVDEEGYLCFAGRAKEVINRGGSKIYPKEIEDVISVYPAVRDVAVVGMPDERMGEIVCAFVLPKDRSRPVSLEELRTFLESEKVMKYMIPEELICLDEFPMTPTGKVRKNSLWEQARDYKKSVKGAIASG